MLNGRKKDERIGTGTIAWRARELRAEGLINDVEFLNLVTSGCVLHFSSE
jgi:dihydroxy-acid dehydratase